MNAVLNSAYARLGARYVWLVVAVACLVGMVQVPIDVWIALRYLDAGARATAQMAGVLALTTTLGLAVGAWAARGVLLPVRQWLADGRPEDRVARLWMTVTSGTFVAVNRAATVVAVLIAPVLLLLAPGILEIGFRAGVTLVLFGELFVVTAWVSLQFILELSFRPLLRDLAARLPSTAARPVAAWSLHAKALTMVPVVAWYAAAAAGAFVVGADGPEARLFAALSAALGVTLVFAGPMAALAGSSILDPMRELVDVTRRVARGDFSTRVAVITDDEFGELARCFNDMQRGLLERDRLRDERLALVEELQHSRARIVAAADASRRQVERDLHDGAQQRLVLLGLMLAQLQRRIAAQDDVTALLAESRTELDRALGELRDLAHGIYPESLTRDGLVAALADAAEHAALPAGVDGDGLGRYPPELEAAVYFCCREALQNAAKYAGEGAVARVSLREVDGELTFEVADDGRGFDLRAVGPATGLQNMDDRIGALGGDLHVESRVGAGTRVFGRVPVQP